MKCYQTRNIFGYPLFTKLCISSDFFHTRNLSADCVIDPGGCSHHVEETDEFRAWVEEVQNEMLSNS